MNTLSSLLKWIGNQLRVTTETFSITRTSGLTLNTGQTSFIRYGKVVSATLVLSASSTETAAGENLFVGTLNTTALRPKTNSARLTAYIGTRAIVATINTAGAVTVRNTSTTSLTPTGDIYLGGTYLIN